MNVELDGAAEEEANNSSLLIKTYGEFWSPEVVDWHKSWRLMGTRRPDSKSPPINIYEERGVYVLYEEYRPVYVGKAYRQSIGYRLQLHRESHRKGPRWDRFSWFGIKGINSEDTLGELNDPMRSTASELIATFEALLILVIDPRMNQRREKFKNAVQLFQSAVDKPAEVEDRLTLIEAKLDKLLENTINKQTHSRRSKKRRVPHP